MIAAALVLALFALAGVIGYACERAVAEQSRPLPPLIRCGGCDALVALSEPHDVTRCAPRASIGMARA